MVELKVDQIGDLFFKASNRSILIGIPFLFIPSWGEVVGPEACPTWRSCTVGKSWAGPPAGESIGARIGTRTWEPFAWRVHAVPFPLHLCMLIGIPSLRCEN